MNRFIQSLSSRVQSLSPTTRKIAIISTAFTALCVLTIFSAHKNDLPHPLAQNSSHTIFRETVPATESALREAEGEPDLKEQERSHAAAKLIPQSEAYAHNDFRAEPRIAYSAEISVATKDFVHARSSMEEILEKHHGYTAKLRMIGQSSGSILSATLKIPASEYSSALADLKAVGNIEQDEEAADEIVQQRGDIEGRLQNAQNEERKLQLLQKDRDNKILDPAALDRQLTALHNEILQMELQRRTFDSRVVFSNIHFALREQHDKPVESISAQLRGAANAGLSDAIRGLSSLLMILASYGPLFLLWAGILFFPARFLWRRSRIAPVREAA